MFKDVYNNATFVQVVDPVVVTADANSTSIDRWDYPGEVTFAALIGESGDTLSGSVYIELEVEESADNSTFTDVADADLSNYVAGNNDGCFGVIDAAAEDDEVYATQYTGSARYVRAVVNVTGTHTNGTPIGVVAIVAGKQYAAGA